MSTIGERIKQARLARGMSQQALADAIGTTKQNIFKYENGIITNIPLDKLEALAAVLGADPTILLGWTEEQPNEKPPDYVPKTPEARTLAVGLDRMTPEQRERAMKLVQLMFDQADIWEDSNGTKT